LDLEAVVEAVGAARSPVEVVGVVLFPVEAAQSLEEAEAPRYQAQTYFEAWEVWVACSSQST
jgi:hypothetical protein